MRLNAGLQILILPLKTSTIDANVIDNVEFVDPIFDEDPFLPSRLYGSESSMAGSQLHLIATATHPTKEDGTTLWFGHSQKTMEENPDEPLWSGSTSICVSLWKTSEGLALTLERISPLDQQIQDFGIDLEEPFAGLSGLASVVELFLRNTGFTAQSSFRELLGDSEEAVTCSTSGTIMTQCITGPQNYRNKNLIEGLLVRIEPSATQQVIKQVQSTKPGFVDFEGANSAQSISIPWDWEAVDLVEEPSEHNAQVAVREDGRFVILNLEAMSIYHDYAGPGGMYLVLACIPEVVRIGALSEKCSTISRMVAAGSSFSDAESPNALDDLVKLRDETEAFQREQVVMTFKHRFVISEKFKTWTHGGQLVALIKSSTSDRVSQMTDELDTMSKALSEMIDKEIQRTTIRLQALEEARASRRIARVGYESGAIGVGALTILIGLFMTTAAAPNWDGHGTIKMWPDSFLITIGTVLFGFIFGWVLRTMRDGKPRERSGQFVER